MEKKDFLLFYVTIRLLITHYLISEYHIDLGTINVIIDSGVFCLDNLYSQLTDISMKHKG